MYGIDPLRAQNGIGDPTEDVLLPEAEIKELQQQNAELRKELDEAINARPSIFTLQQLQQQNAEQAREIERLRKICTSAAKLLDKCCDAPLDITCGCDECEARRLLEEVTEREN